MRRGASALEVLVVLGIVGVALAVVYLVYGGTTSVDREDAASQEYFNTYSRLEARLKQDLRSSTELAGDAVNGYRLQVVVAPDKRGSEPVLQTVTWRLSSDGTKVVRTAGSQVTNFDFKGLLGGKRFVLHIKR